MSKAVLSETLLIAYNGQIINDDDDDDDECKQFQLVDSMLFDQVRLALDFWRSRNIFREKMAQCPPRAAP